MIFPHNLLIDEEVDLYKRPSNAQALYEAYMKAFPDSKADVEERYDSDSYWLYVDGKAYAISSYLSYQTEKVKNLDLSKESGCEEEFRKFIERLNGGRRVLRSILRSLGVSELNGLEAAHDKFIQKFPERRNNNGFIMTVPESKALNNAYASLVMEIFNNRTHVGVA